MGSERRRWWAWLALALIACVEGPEGRDPASDAGGLDADPLDAGGPEAGPLIPSGCPLPPVVRPDDVPDGYLQAELAPLYRPVDGDTAHFDVGADHPTVRFLFVNTEESNGDETTEFGVQTAATVGSLLRDASDIVLTAREDPDRSGQPEVDRFERWLSLVFVDGELLETTLVRAGLSAYYTAFGCAPEPVHSSLLWAEAEAREEATRLVQGQYAQAVHAVVGGCGCSHGAGERD